MTSVSTTDCVRPPTTATAHGMVHSQRLCQAKNSYSPPPKRLRNHSMKLAAFRCCFFTLSVRTFWHDSDFSEHSSCQVLCRHRGLLQVVSVNSFSQLFECFLTIFTSSYSTEKLAPATKCHISRSECSTSFLGRAVNYIYITGTLF